MSYNYFDGFQQQLGDYAEFLNKRYINAAAPSIKVYVLERNGPDDTLYNEELNRIYLPYFSIRGLYVTQKWTQPLAHNAITEPEEDSMTIVLNLDDMVKTMRYLKNSHNSDIYITYTGGTRASAKKENEVLTLYEECDIIAEYNMSEYCLEDLAQTIHGLTGFDATTSGDLKESGVNLVDFSLTQISNTDILNIYTFDNKYEDIADFIQIGDIIISHHNILYEVADAYVSNLKFFQWPAFIIKGEKRQLSDNMQLPNHGLDNIYADSLLLQRYNYTR
jgi:hypothetical protein